ncbi:PaeR7I family type II restriction endonuclease [Nocardia sp. NRRL S-836]|uniref:PaeR7I family type II restriction endonuclease n=1 Tax=Nocardia sp. NRRL S-836 TaxID=1519492 RepID=UPI0006AD8733|nr:PaeR7I family type II restriction endonuclease [Nocardia sp. NRRL S-836]
MTPEQQKDIDNALLAYWTSRDEARIVQERKGKSDQGARAGATAGGHLDRVAQLFANVCIAAGVPKEKVYYKAPKDDPNRKSHAKMLTMPGYFRPTKSWDLVVYHEKTPIVVLELKSQNGPSYGNNANNRVEEALGSAVDLAAAHRAGLLSVRPWTGYVFVVEDDERSRYGNRGLGNVGPAGVDPVFTTWSYIGRLSLVCKRLVAEQHYHAAWTVATSRPSCPAGIDADVESRKKSCPQYTIDKKNPPATHKEHEFGWNEPDPEGLGYVQFVTAMTAAIGEYYPVVPATGLPDIST